MIRIVLLLIVLAAAALGISWLLDRPGEITILWLGARIETSVFVALAVVLLACVVFTLLWSLFAFFFRVPTLMSLARRTRRRAKGHDALSRGMIAVGAGDLRAARRASDDVKRVLPQEPLALLLRAQVAQMEGDRAEADATFAAMADRDDTRLIGLRGLHVEARRRGDDEAAHHFAREAHRIAPLAWAGDAIVVHHATRGQWEQALATVESNERARVIDAAAAARQRAVLETAIAQDKEFTEPAAALSMARDAVRRAPDLVPAVALAARLLSRNGDFRTASKMIERAWDKGPHPDLGAAYLSVRPGDSSADRFARAMTLYRRKPDHAQSRMLVAETALAMRDFARARTTMAPLFYDGERPTTQQCLMMADIEETENGETGLLREWLGRASRAQRDATWVADGVTSARWAPASPVTGTLDAFRWETPREELIAGPREPATAPMAAESKAPPPVALPVVVEAAKGPVVAESVVVAEPVEIAPASPAQRPAADATPTVSAMTSAPAMEASAAPPQSLGTSMQASGFSAGPRPVVFPLAASPDDPGPRPSGAPYSGGFR